MQNGYGGIHILTVFPVLYRSFSHFSEQTPVLLDAELGFVDTLTTTGEAGGCVFIVMFRCFFEDKTACVLFAFL